MRTNKNKKPSARETAGSGLQVGRFLTKAATGSGKFSALPTIKEMARPLLPQIRFN
jgi:hypothetical protein